MSFLAKWQATAFDQTCTITTGSAVSGGESSYPDIPCMEVPPTDLEDDTRLKLFLEDTNTLCEPGCRVTYNSIQYLVERIQWDEAYPLLILKSWPESLS